jgi:dCMP deaminase
MNVIFNATFNGVSLDGASLYVYGLPVCSECAKGIIQVGVKRIVILTDDIVPDIWTNSFKITSEMLSEAGVEWQWVQT